MRVRLCHGPDDAEMSRERVRLAHVYVDPLPSSSTPKGEKLDPMALRIGLLYTTSEFADAGPARGEHRGDPHRC